MATRKASAPDPVPAKGHHFLAYATHPLKGDTVYVILRTRPTRAFVAPKGSKKSYTPQASRAQIFRTREAAEAFGVCVENEVVVPLGPLVRGVWNWTPSAPPI